MNEKPIEVSVVMPAYQIENFLAEAIESVLQQTYPHFELLILDDASTDRTLEIAQSYANKDGRIRILMHAQNLGISQTINDMLQAARHEWIFHLDGDDRMLPERIELQLAFLREHPDLVLSAGWIYYINSEGRRIGELKNPFTSEEKIQKEIMQDHVLWFPSPTLAFHGPTALKIGGYRDLSPGMDTDLCVRLARLGPVLCQPKFLAEYRIRPKSISVKEHAKALTVARWISTSMHAYRLGQPEPDFNTFLAYEKNLPLLKRLPDMLYDQSAIAYKKSVVAFSRNNYFLAGFYLGLSALLWPKRAWQKISLRKISFGRRGL